MPDIKVSSEGRIEDVIKAEAEALNKQLELELSMVENGKTSFWRGIESARKRGEEATTGYGQRLLRSLIEPMTQALIAFIEGADTGLAGRRHTAVRYVRAVEPEVVSYLTLKAVLDGITRQEKASSVALRIANALSDELRMRKLKAEQPEQFQFVRKVLQREHHQGRIRTLARYYSNKVSGLAVPAHRTRRSQKWRTPSARSTSTCSGRA